MRRDLSKRRGKVVHFQGFRLFHNIHHGKESLRIPCEATYFSGHIADRVISQPVEGGIPEGGEVLCRMSAKDGRSILIERRITHVVEPVLDGSPMTSRQFQQALCSSTSKA